MRHKLEALEEWERNAYNINVLEINKSVPNAFKYNENSAGANLYLAAVMQFACEFVLSKDEVPTTPRGDPIGISRALWKKYAP